MIVPAEKKDGSGRNIQDSTSLRRGWKRQTREKRVSQAGEEKTERKTSNDFQAPKPSVTKGTGDSSMGVRLDAVGMV